MNRRRDSSKSDRLIEKKKSSSGEREGEKKIKFSPKDTPGVICIERHMQDGAVAISGSLMIKCKTGEISDWIEEEVGRAVAKVNEHGGRVGQIKVTVTETSTSEITVTDDRALVKETPQKQVRIMLAAVVFEVEPKDAEEFVRRSLAGVRARVRQEEN